MFYKNWLALLSARWLSAQPKKPYFGVELCWIWLNRCFFYFYFYLINGHLLLLARTIIYDERMGTRTCICFRHSKAFRYDSFREVVLLVKLDNWSKCEWLSIFKQTLERYFLFPFYWGKFSGRMVQRPHFRKLLSGKWSESVFVRWNHSVSRML